MSELELVAMRRKIDGLDDVTLIEVLVTLHKLVESGRATRYTVETQTLVLGEVFDRFVPPAVFGEAFERFENGAAPDTDESGVLSEQGTDDGEGDVVAPNPEQLVRCPTR